MEKECECYEEEVQPYRKTYYKPIIYKMYKLKTYFYCRMSCIEDKSTKLVDNERVINCLFRPND